MADERVVSDMVTKFLLNTCRLCPQLNINAIQAAGWCAWRTSQTTLYDDDVVAEHIPMITGSMAEFYIEPMLPHVGDVDLMFHLSTELAIPQGHPPPTQLPAEFHNYVQVYEIVDGKIGLPGYVYLKLRYLLTECIEDDKYNFMEYHHEEYLSHCPYGKFGINSHGPAIVRDHSRTPWLSIDNVYCIRCMLWPTQAADWPKRHRDWLARFSNCRSCC